MATLTRAFHQESERVHREHYQLTEELHTLGIALDHIHADLNDTANLIAAKEIQMFAKRMADELPGHFQREEREIFSTVSEVSSELDFFAREMRRQHENLQARLTSFCRAIGEMATTGDMAATVEEVRNEGKAFTCELARHIALEEQELRGFL